jgi:hypothetical protein
MTWDQISEYLRSGKLDVPDDELDVYRHLKVGLKPNEKAIAILEAKVNHAPAETQPVEPVRPSRGKVDQHDVSVLDIGEHLVYKGDVLANARVMASTKSKKFDYKREFKAKQVGNEIHITRVK